MKNVIASALATILLLTILEFVGVPALSWLTAAVNWTRGVLSAAVGAAASTG